MVVLKYIANAVIITLLLAIAFVLLVVPFFFVLPRLVLAPYFLVDQKLGPIVATRRSWQATKGHAGKIWGIIGASLAMALLAVTIIGIPFAIYFLFMYGAASALAYDFVAKQTALTQPAPAPASLDTPVDASPTVS
jgi:membrane-anchored glycerophosphoryl diester phosphodiesterase (GDPDase)